MLGDSGARRLGWRSRAAAALVAALALGAADRATAEPVLVELFTSQGCSSCPPADKLLGEIADDPNVVALTMNVDYWNYLGWRDRLSRPEFTRRQKAYAYALGEKMVYTPQIVVHGADGVVGSNRAAVEGAIAAHSAQPPRCEVTIAEAGGALEITIAPLDGVEASDEPATVRVVAYYGPHEEAIGRGENAGRKITYHNVAREIVDLGTWSGAAAKTFSTPIDREARGYAVIVQMGDTGPVMAAAKHEL